VLMCVMHLALSLSLYLHVNKAKRGKGVLYKKTVLVMRKRSLIIRADP